MMCSTTLSNVLVEIILPVFFNVYACKVAQNYSVELERFSLDCRKGLVLVLVLVLVLLRPLVG